MTRCGVTMKLMTEIYCKAIMMIKYHENHWHFSYEYSLSTRMDNDKIVYRDNSENEL